MDLWEIYKASKGVPHSGDMYDALMGKSLGGGSVWETENAPYLFRQSGGALNSRLMGKEKDCLVGGTVAFNQQVSIASIPATQTVSGVTFTNNADGTVTVSGTATEFTHPKIGPEKSWQAHKYAVFGCPAGGSKTTYALAMRGVGGDTWDLGNGAIWNAAGNTWKAICAYVQSGVTVNNLVFKPQIFDLTQMFGSTIADYIYSLEQANAGAGVAWFKKLFPKPYYAYNAGEIKSVCGLTSHEMVGFNAWDEEWEVGSIDSTTGDNSPTITQIRSKGYIPCLPNTQYYFQSPRTGNDVRIAFYRSDKSYRSMSGWSYNGIFTTPDDCYYIRFYMASAYGTTYNHDICINLSWDGSRDGEYEPYQKWSYPLDSDLELRGIPKIENGNLYYDGDVYEADGTVTRKCGIVVLDGTQHASAFVEKDNTVRRMIVGADINQAKNASNICRIIADCPTYTPDYVYINDVSGVSENKNMTSSGMWVAIEKSKLSEVSVQGFNDYLSQHPITVVYPLETPTTESADSYTSPQIVNDFGTEEYVVTEQSGVAVPVGHETQYKVTAI